ncbi:MAG: hypothetical protein LUH04_00635 [Clostridium sp.]|nr:hypothetical protein [Clostridium sp.]
MGNNRIDRIKEDRYGKIWTYTAYTKETYRFDPVKEKYVMSFYIGNTPFQTSDILVMPSGRVWLISDTMGAICVPDTTHHSHIFSQENNSLKSNHVNSVFEDKEGGTWILTDDGVLRVQHMGEENEKKELFYYTHPTAEAVFSFFTCSETDTEIWFGADKGHILCFDKKTAMFSLFDTGVSSEIIAIENIHDYLLVILTSGDGFFICDRYKTNLKKFDRTNLRELPTNDMKSCFIDSYNNIWLELGVPGIARFSLVDNRLQYYQSETSSIGDFMFPPRFSIVEDNSHRIWVHPSGGGFSYYDPHTDKLIPFFNDPSSSDWKFSHMLHDMYLDDRGNLWLSTRTDGIEKITFDDETFKVSDFPEENSALNFEIRALFEDSDRNIWLGSKEGYVTIYDSQKRFKGYLSVQGSISKTAPPLKLMAYAITKDREDNIWIGSKGNGLFRLKAVDDTSDIYTIRNYTHSFSDIYSISNNSIYSVYEDEKGRIWVGTLGGGVNLFDPVNERFINYYNELKNYPIGTGHEVRAINSLDDMIYIATSLGLVVFPAGSQEIKDSGYKIYTHTNQIKDGLNANDIYSIYVTKDKDLYIATQGGGLSRVEEFDPEGFPVKFHTYDTDNKLMSDVILSVIEDKNGKLWIVSEGNLSVYDPRTDEVEWFTNVARILDNKFFSEALPLMTHSREIILGSTQGTLSFIPEQIKKDEYVPNLIFTGFRVSGENFIPQGQLDYCDRVSLNYNQHTFIIEFAALDFSNPQSILYAYKLDGLESDWTYSRQQRQVNYANLSPGTYTFRVKSTNSNGVWVDNERALQIVIKPSFWQTQWAWLLYFVLFSLILFIILRSIFVFYRMRDKMRMEQEQVEMKTRFFTDISHEIRTPLTMIVSPIEDMIDNNKVLPEAEPQLRMVLKNANRMLNMVNQILDFRKIRKQKLHIEGIDPGIFTEDVCRNFLAAAESKNIRLVVNNEIADDKVWVDPDSLEKLIYNLLSNAIKYTAGGKK